MRYLLCWLADWDINQLTPVSTVQDLLVRANDGDPDALANTVRLNWMIQHLRANPMLKPIFCRDDEFHVIVGDTRIMAARLAGLAQVPVMAYLHQALGPVCRTLDDVKVLSGFGADAVLQWSPNVDPLTEPPDWIDIGDYRTAGHGHNEGLRLTAIQNLLKKNPQLLTLEWLLEPRDWGDIFN
jgi:hypothetical protein